MSPKAKRTRKPAARRPLGPRRCRVDCALGLAMPSTMRGLPTPTKVLLSPNSPTNPLNKSPAPYRRTPFHIDDPQKDAERRPEFRELHVRKLTEAEQAAQGGPQTDLASRLPSDPGALLARLSLCGCGDVTDRGVLMLLSACSR